MTKLSLQNTLKISIVAAIYVVLTIVLGDFAYGPIQLRIAEVLVLLCFFDKRYGYGVVIGCAIANCLSTIGPIDILFGTIATILSVVLISYSKHLGVAVIWAPIFNGVIIGLELHFVLGLPLLLSCLEVFLGEAIVVVLIGTPVYALLMKNKGFVRVITLDESERNKNE